MASSRPPERRPPLSPRRKGPGRFVRVLTHIANRGLALWSSGGMWSRALGTFGLPVRRPWWWAPRILDPVLTGHRQRAVPPQQRKQAAATTGTVARPVLAAEHRLRAAGRGEGDSLIRRLPTRTLPVRTLSDRSRPDLPGIRLRQPRDVVPSSAGDPGSQIQIHPEPTLAALRAVPDRPLALHLESGARAPLSRALARAMMSTGRALPETAARTSSTAPIQQNLASTVQRTTRPGRSVVLRLRAQTARAPLSHYPPPRRSARGTMDSPVRTEVRRQPGDIGGRLPPVNSPTRHHDGSVAPRSPAARWQHAVRTRPLETPRLFPEPLRPWARALSGQSAPRFTAGPATSAALHAAGAHAASTTDTVHVPTTPSGSRAIDAALSHELVHLRQPLSRPRFLLRRPGQTLDADERRAAAAAAAWPAGPVAAVMGGRPDDVGLGRAGPPRPLGLGAPVSELPVTRPAAAADVAGAAPRQAVASLGAVTTQPPMTLPAFGHGPGDGWSLGDPVPSGLATTQLSGAWRTAAGVSQASASIPAFGQPPTAGPHTALDAASTAPLPDAAPAASQAGATSSDQQPASALSVASLEHLMDGILDALEQRLVSDLERRGGRYAGVF